MSGLLTIIMYHYVRDLRASRYPAIKGLDVALFEKQLDFITRNHEVITSERLIAAIQGDQVLPDKAALLTFDDGYADHFRNVFPALDKRGLQGSFFPPVMSVLNGRVLDVNKIHFVLASAGDISRLLAAVFEELDRFRHDFNLQDNDLYYQKLSVPGRFDPPEVIFIKRLLQTELPVEARSLITDRLFKRFVGVAEGVMSRELYMDRAQLECMRRHGMFIGSHGLRHEWLGAMPATEQEKEIDASVEFLHSIGASQPGWAMCYPYGDYNASTLEILRSRGCVFGLTTRVGLADLSAQPALELPRVDTNDVPPVGPGIR